MTWTNWSGSFSCEPAALLFPESEGELIELVQRAREDGARIRVVGTGHSCTPLVATDGRLVSLDRMSGVVRAEPEESRAWVRTGTKLHDLGGSLHDLGFAMENLGDIDVQALGGALGTGTHGTGVALPNLSARVSGVRLIDGEGNLRVIKEDQPELLRAARVSLGALGILTAARLELVPAFRLHERIERLPIERCLAELDERIARTRHFEFFWYPSKDQAEAKSLHPTHLPAEAAAGKYERIDWSHRILPSVRELRFFEMEYAVPAEAGPACFRAVRERMQARHGDVVWPVEYRTVAADDALLSPAQGRATVTISIHQDGQLPYEAFFRDVEPILTEHGGRPHWGKAHTREAPDLEATLPGFAQFARLRRGLDPDGVFLNPHLEAILGV
jgi:FAD/FMN-containing dehydrogenase